MGNKTPEEIEAEIKSKEEAKEAKGKKGKKGGKDKKEKKAKKGKGKKGKDKGAAEEDPGWKMKASKFSENVDEKLTDYDTKWKFRNESHNISQRHDEEIIKEEKILEVEAELRKEVDVIMREELENLKAALDKDKGKKGKKARKAKKERRRGKI